MGSNQTLLDLIDPNEFGNTQRTPYEYSVLLFRLPDIFQDSEIANIITRTLGEKWKEFGLCNLFGRCTCMKAHKSMKWFPVHLLLASWLWVIGRREFLARSWRALGYSRP